MKGRRSHERRPTPVALSAISEEETAAAVLAALAKRGGAEAIVGIDGAVARLVAEMRRGTEWARENATAALVLLCQRLGARAVTQVMAMPGVEWAIWELMYAHAHCLAWPLSLPLSLPMPASARSCRPATSNNLNKLAN